MKRQLKLFSILFAAGAFMVSCSSDEPVITEGGDNNVAKGDVAYLKISIKSVPEDPAMGSRAESSETVDGTNKEYIYGDESEHTVNNAYFYFYDADGNFVTEANRWTGGADGTEENVEYLGNNTVILEHLTGKNYPKWVVTILNRPDGFQYGETLDAMGEIVLNSGQNADGTFIMTTSSYFGTDNKDNNGTTWRYFATQLKDENFLQQLPDKETFDENNRVQIYVERLAARVGIHLAATNEKIAEKYVENGQKYDIYRVDATVGGNDNPSTGDDLGGAAATKLYVAITGWQLTTTAKQTNLVKDLSGWTDATTFTTTWAWNKADYHRSFWGKSTTYGLSGNDLTAKLNVGDKTYSKLDKKVSDKVFTGDRVYCNENTNAIANVTSNNSVEVTTIDPTKTTSVLLRAVVCDENGTPVQLVNYLGVNYRKDSFIAKAFKNSGADIYYTRTPDADEPTFADGTPNYVYTPITPASVKVVSNHAEQGTGAVKLAIADEDIEYFTVNGTESYVWTDPTDENRKVTITKPKATPAAVTAINEKLASATAGASNKAVAYTDGASYYPIAIEHLNKPTGSTMIEGQYGVVRNHIYTINITKIKTLGEGVYAPRPGVGGEEEAIIPPVKDPIYYVESAINILSWKVVKQNVEI